MNSPESPKILITGSSSFIGKGFIRYSAFREIEEISVRDRIPDAKFFSEYNVVLHVAAIVHQTTSIPVSEYMRVNRDIAVNVAQRAKEGGAGHFIFMSTLKVYGPSALKIRTKNENTECIPDEPYGKSKYEAEKELLLLQDENFLVSIIRSPLVYGEGVKANMLSLVRLIKKYPLLPLGKIYNRRNYVFVGNLSAYIDRIIQKRARGTFIAIDAESPSTTELVRIISGSMNKKVLLVSIPGCIRPLVKKLTPQIFNRLYESVEFDNSETLKKLDFKPPYELKEGIDKMVYHYLNPKC